MTPGTEQVRNSFHPRIVRGLIQKINQEALKNALPKVNINGATGPFKFRPAQTKSGKLGGWDADQKPFIYLVQGGQVRAVQREVKPTQPNERAGVSPPRPFSLTATIKT